jgi:putative peptidoglycan lipid II flippase
VGHATVEIVDRVFYAFHDTWTPVKIAMGAIAANLVLSLVLMRTPLNYGGLALANALAAVAEGGGLVWLLSRKMRSAGGEGLGLVQIGDGLGRIALAAAIMGVVVVLLREVLFQWIELAPTLEHAIVLTLCVAAGAVTYLVLARTLGVDEVTSLWRLIRGR